MIVVVSVHADDAVFSVGEFIARQEESVRVVTICGSWPDDPDERAWQKTLNAENNAACRHLQAGTAYLPFLDGKWGAPADDHMLLDQLAAEMTHAKRVLVPLGIHHPDHLRYAPLALSAALASGARVAVYEDLPYRAMYPEETAEQRAALIARFGHNLESAASAGYLKEKLTACAMYVSQWGDDAQRHCSVYERVWWVR